MAAKLKMKLKIEFTKCVKWTDAWKLVPEAYIELFKDKSPQQCRGQHIIGDEPGLVAYDRSNNVVGFISYYKYSNDMALAIAIAYVVPEHRKKGVHTALFKALVAHAQDIDAVYISSGANLDNVASQRSQESQGRDKESFNYGYHVPPKKQKT